MHEIRLHCATRTRLGFIDSLIRVGELPKKREKRKEAESGEFLGGLFPAEEEEGA